LENREVIAPFSARADRPSPALTRAARRPVPAPIRIAGAGLLIAAVTAYWALGGNWWLAPVLLLAPDLSAIGFLVSNRFGVPAYNSAHRLWAPLALLALALLTGSRISLLVAVAWLGHIGMDRAAGYGLRDVAAVPETA